MKAVSKVDSEGLFIEDTIMDDAFSGVVPFYSQFEKIEEKVAHQPVGYIVGIPVPPGLFHPRFDLAAWEKREQDEAQNPSTYWKEGLSPEEIEELTRPLPQGPTELDRMGAELVARELEALELILQNEALGAQIVGLELRLLSVENQGGTTNV
ncbi:hypothetical protein DFP94_101182 [Fontibacillus phaseoli]|uniref:Uncharacterized protein n=1 Tax=Fontibacillus phaseoli TaxID=1416533 RepID=A0A369BLX5_9BACL|nr:hypothetical protein [Fontibacillus phaseoli]RCX22602.1 hypothetical protein DFP94_101182 [Fontibacillus phaseoli]